MKDFSQLERTIGCQFRDKNLLNQALVHRSYLNENPGFALQHNERLEFLGDAVLELVVTEYLYKKYPQTPEGDLTNWRAALVNSQQLSQLSKELGLDDFLYLSRGESRDTNSKARQTILANAFEALIGALYLDQGFEPAQVFIDKQLLVKLDYILEHHLYIDPKSRFQEESQERLGVTPLYRVLEESGPDHHRHFIVGVFLNEELIAQGEGASKQEAQMAAAHKALKEKEWE